MKPFLIFFFCYTTIAHSAGLIEKTKAQVGAEMISLIDVKNFQKREKLGLLPDSLLLDTFYKKTPPVKQQKKPLSKKERALNYLIAREMIWQKLNQPQQDKNQPQLPEPNITKLLKNKKGVFSPSQFLSQIKRAGFRHLLEYQAFLKKEEKINLFIMSHLTPKITLSSSEIESAFFKAHKRKLFSDYEYDFLLVSFGEDKKEQVLQSLQKNEHLKNFKKWAESLKLNFKNSKLKSKEIANPIKKELDKLSVSQNSSLLFLNSSYYLIQLQWKEPLTEPKDRDKKRKIEQKLYQKKLLQELNTWIQNEKNQFFIKLSSL